jgi:hypothetical protein
MCELQIVISCESSIALQIAKAKSFFEIAGDISEILSYAKKTMTIRLGRFLRSVAMEKMEHGKRIGFHMVLLDCE